MNVYFIDPTYVKPEGWEPLLKYLKVKEVYSLIPQRQLPVSLCSIVENHLKAIYPHQKINERAKYCTYWLKAYFEKHIHLINSDFPDYKNAPKEEFRKYSSQSPYNNLRLDTENCLILLELESKYDVDGTILAPECWVDAPESLCGEINVPTHIAAYCLNILHKKHKHKLYQVQSAFIIIDKYFANTFRYNHNLREWKTYSVLLKDKSHSFTHIINCHIHNIAPDLFPVINTGNKKCYSIIINEDGINGHKKFIKEAEEHANAYYEAINSDYDDGEDWQTEVAEMVRDFWKECGSAASNCESWPGWD